MQKTRNLDKKSLQPCALLVSVFAFSLVTPANFKKPYRTTRGLPDDRPVNNADIETYWDQKCTKRVSSIDWGTLDLGSGKTLNLLSRNKGKTRVTLSHYIANCNPFEIAN